MKIIGLQLNSIVGDVHHNLTHIRQEIKRVSVQRPDFIVLPELALTGYPPHDFLMQPDFVDKIERGVAEFKRISAEFPDTAILFSYPKYHPLASVSYPRFTNHVDVVSNGEVVFSQAKTCLPEYDVFYDKRYFIPNADPMAVFSFRGVKLGFLICEDLWSGSEFADDTYARCPVTELAALAPDIVIASLASPFRVGFVQRRQALAAFQSQRLKCPIMCVNQVGANDQLIFDGSSFVADSRRIYAQAHSFKEDVLELNLSPQSLSPLSSSSLPCVMDPMESIYHALSLGIRDYVAKTGLSSIVLGVSGGIDSAVVCALAVNAVGASNVHALLMPTRFNSSISRDDGVALCENLGVQYTVITIQDLFDGVCHALDPLLSQYQWDHTEENIQARLRGVLVMAYANKLNAMAVSTGNKSEMAMGYATLYGDMNGGLNIIGDLYKGQVYALARHINSRQADRSDIIPDRIITRPPSAELREGQLDQDTLPEYDILDSILKQHIEENKRIEDIISTIGNEDTVRWVISRLYANDHKRFQSAPILKVSHRTFGKGRPMPLASRFLEKRHV